MSTETVTWIAIDVELPDDDETVLIALDDGDVWTGFVDAGQWRYVSADLVEARVTHWMAFPAAPGNAGIHRAAEGRPVE